MKSAKGGNMKEQEDLLLYMNNKSIRDEFNRRLNQKSKDERRSVNSYSLLERLELLLKIVDNRKREEILRAERWKRYEKLGIKSEYVISKPKPLEEPREKDTMEISQEEISEMKQQELDEFRVKQEAMGW
jgi:hypothetical protein